MTLGSVGTHSLPWSLIWVKVESPEVSGQAWMMGITGSASVDGPVSKGMWYLQVHWRHLALHPLPRRPHGPGVTLDLVWQAIRSLFIVEGAG